jgi:hypothetical protein
MLVGSYKQSDHKRSQVPARENPRYAWKERTYVVPTPSRKGFQWKASALRSIQRLSKTEVTGHPVTVVVPALYSFMPAEAVALGWLNEIDALGTIRHRIADSTKLTGWDVFTFHTRHNLDPYYASTIAAVRETWLREGSLKASSIAETVKQYGPAYQYNCIPARLVENLVFQSSLMDWLSARADGAPFRFHVVGTALLSALVWSSAMTFDDAVRTAVKVGARWDASLTSLVEAELGRNGTTPSEENLGWLRFDRVRQILEGRAVVSLGTSGNDFPDVDAPWRPFWFSTTANAEPVLIETARDVQYALESMDLASWSPALPKRLPTDCADRVRGWLVSPLHPMASTCRWSVYNYLLATPNAGLFFLDHIAAVGRRPVMAPRPEEFQKRLRLQRAKVTGS